MAGNGRRGGGDMTAQLNKSAQLSGRTQSTDWQWHINTSRHNNKQNKSSKEKSENPKRKRIKTKANNT